jgi:two-component response regulator (ARR-B family)
MCADNKKSDVMKAVDDGACDYWTKPLPETLIQNMWQHVARKLWNESKNLQLSEKEERYDSKLPLIDPKLGVINTNAKQESIEKNNDNSESSAKKTRVRWSSELHKKFVSVITELNVDSMILYQFLFFYLRYLFFKYFFLTKKKINSLCP